MHSKTDMKKFLLVFCVLVLFLCASEATSWPWWFNQSNEELIDKALKSSNPRTVEKCLDKLIQREQYSGVLQIKHHAQEMARSVRNKLLQQRNLDAQKTQKRLAPWVKIENKAIQFFKRTNVKQNGKDPSVP